jgi:hypothetical protein
MASVHDWTGRQCAEWLEQDVSLLEHVPLFMGAGIDGSNLLHLDEPKLKSLGIDDIDCEIIVARLRLLERMDCRSKSSWQRPAETSSSGAVLYNTQVDTSRHMESSAEAGWHGCIWAAARTAAASCARTGNYNNKN